MICIYKITSPTNKVYIGQTINYARRFSAYKNLKCKAQIKIHSSLLKYGFDNHIFEIVEECNILELNEKERYYQDLYNCTGLKGLNLILTKTTDKSGIMSLESRKKMSKAKKGFKLPESTKLNMSKKIVSQEARDKMRVAMTGKKQSALAIEKSRVARIGLKRTDEQIKRNVLSRINYRATEETKQKMSLAHKGKTFSVETRAKLSTAKKNSAKIILDQLTGIFYFGSREAAKLLGYSEGYTNKMLTGDRPNKTNLIYV